MFNERIVSGLWDTSCEIDGHDRAKYSRLWSSDNFWAGIRGETGQSGSRALNSRARKRNLRSRYERGGYMNAVKRSLNGERGHLKHKRLMGFAYDVHKLAEMCAMYAICMQFPSSKKRIATGSCLDTKCRNRCARGVSTFDETLGQNSARQELLRILIG